MNHRVTQPVTGITFFTKVYFYCAGVITKFLANLIVLVAGSGAVLRSDNNFDLILSALFAPALLLHFAASCDAASRFQEFHESWSSTNDPVHHCSLRSLTV